MKNLKCFVLGIVFTVFIFLIPHDLFAKITNFSPIKSGTEVALSIFLEAEKEFKNGQKFQKEEDFEKALKCYAKSLELWPTNETYFRLTFCLYSAKFYSTAGKMILVGLESAKQKGDLKNYFCFLLLMADIYYEVGNFNKALSIYEHLAELAVDERLLKLIEKRIGETLFKIVFNP